MYVCVCLCIVSVVDGHVDGHISKRVDMNDRKSETSIESET